jgi:hypothetical protein
MKLRSGKRYKVEDCWWYKYTIEACNGKNLEEDEDKDLFRYNEHSIKEWYEKVLPLFESRQTIKGVASVK